MKYIFILFLSILLFSNCKKTKIEIQKEAVLLSSAKSLTISAAENSTITFDIAANIDWEASSNQDWLKISAQSGNGNTTITLTASANSQNTTRNATISVSGKDVNTLNISITQLARTTQLSVSSNTLTIAPSLGSTATFDIVANTEWTINSDQSWLSLDKTSGNGDANVKLTAQSTAFTERNAKVSILVNGSVAQTINVTQTAMQLSTDSKPNWTISALDFQYTSTYIVKVSISGVEQSVNDGDELAAFAGTECRGVASIVTSGVNKVFYLLVKGNQASNETITMKYYQKSISHIFDINLSKTFIANETFGTSDVPYILEAK